ncbi:hypothetical protein ACHAWF_015183 [Thalassiosira exigua]
MAASSDEGSNVDVSLTHLKASRIPLMRRFDQQFALEKKVSDYHDEISRISKKNQAALSSLDNQERRLRELQAMLRSPSCAQTSNEPNRVHPRSSVVSNDAANNRGTPTPHEMDGEEVGGVQKKQTTDSKPLSSEADSCRTIATDAALSQSSITDEAAKETRISGGVTDPPTHVTVAQIRHDSFTVLWDVGDQDAVIVDYEIKYCHDARQVSCRLSRWCLKDPVPRGRFVVENLEPDTEYGNIAIRCRSASGWSSFSSPIKSVLTASRDDDYESRRGKFLYRIGKLEQTIKSLDKERQQIPAQQVLLSRKMAHLQDERILELNEEIERVVSHEGDGLLSSHLLHGSNQFFTKPTLKRRLEQEVVICKESIAEWRAEIIDLDEESSELAAEIKEKESQLSERKTALLKFDRQHDIVSGMKCVLSKRPADLKRFYFTLLRSRVADRLEVKRALKAVSLSCRRRLYVRAWHHLSSLVASRREALRTQSERDPDGIGGVLLNFSEKCMLENLDEASHVVNAVKEIRDNKEDVMAPISVDHFPAHLLCIEDRETVKKGDFLFNSEHFESALRSYNLVLSNMEHRSYFSGLSSVDAAALYAEINGKIGHVYIKLQSFDKGIVYFGRQLSLAGEEDLDAARACALLGLGMCYHGKCDHVYSEKFFMRALDLCISRGDQARERDAYSWLKRCCECQNRQAEANAFSEKIKCMDKTSWFRDSGGRAISRKGVDSALRDLDSMRRRLVDATAKKSRVVKLEVASAHRVKLQRARSAKEQQLRQARERSQENKELSVELQDLLEDIGAEISEAKTSKKNRVISYLVQGTKQDVKTSELIIRLDEERKVVEKKLSDCLEAIPETEMFIHNTKDDIAALKEELVVEQGSLMKRVLQNRKYRCIALNASNVACDDVSGANGEEPYVATSEGETSFIHDLGTGKLENVFIGDEEGSSATVTALFFVRNRVYTGTMDSILLGWDLPTSKKLFAAEGHEAAVTCIYADDSKIISGSADKSLIVWNTDGVLMRRGLGHLRGVQTVQCGPKWCISGSYGTVLVWDILTDNGFNCRRRLVLPGDGHVTSLQYGELEAITGDSVGYITVWWIESSELLRRFKAHDGPVASLQVDATKSVSCGHDMIVNVSDVIKGEVLHSLRGHAAPVLAVAFDRKQIVSVSSDGEIRYWSWTSNKRGEAPRKQTLSTLRIDFSGTKHEDSTTNSRKEDGGEIVSGSRPSEMKGSLINRIAGKLPRRSLKK